MCELEAKEFFNITDNSDWVLVSSINALYFLVMHAESTNFLPAAVMFSMLHAYFL
jgi:hypothetical protein